MMSVLREQVKTDLQQASTVLEELKAPDAADIVNDLTLDDAAIAILMLPLEDAIAVFNEPRLERRPDLIAVFEPEKAAAILQGLSADERTKIFRHLGAETRQKLLPLLSLETRGELEKLLSYSPNSAAGIMTTEFVRLSPDMTVSTALKHIRSVARHRATIYAAYVLEPDTGRLMGALSLRDLVMAEMTQPISTIMRKYPIAVEALDDREKVARILAKYNLLAVPVLDEQHRVLGFVTVDDALDVLTEEQTEDVQRLGGMQVIEEPYFLTSFWQMVRKRAPWLVALFLGELFTGTAMRHYDAEIEVARLLVFFIPLIISSGGNSGSQSATLVVRSLALGEIRPAQWLRLLLREMRIGLALGVILSPIGLVRALLWGTGWGVASTVALTLVVVVLLGAFIGAALPLVFRRFGFDPAVSSTPFIASLVDVAGIVTYFSIAGWLLGL
jgi:magnesium transporter